MTNTQADSPVGAIVHPNALCESKNVGDGTRISAFVRIAPGAVIGRNCTLHEGVVVDGDVILGDGVAIQSGVHLCDGLRVADHVSIGANATFAPDVMGTPVNGHQARADVTIEEDAVVGANATILSGIRISRHARIAPGSVVTKAVPANAIVEGNPAVITGYRTKNESRIAKPTQILSSQDRVQQLDVGQCELWRLPHFGDLRGDLVPIESKTDLPFVPKRSFLVYGVPTDKVRGEHAHRKCHQFLIAAHGELSVVLDDGVDRVEIQLTSPEVGLWLRPMVWGIQYKFSADASLLVFTSHSYDAGDYLRDYNDFYAAVSAARSKQG